MRLRIINIIKNSCIDTLPHSWSKPKKLNRKIPNPVKLQNHINTAKLINLYRSGSSSDDLPAHFNEPSFLNEWSSKINTYNSDYKHLDLPIDEISNISN